VESGSPTKAGRGVFVASDRLFALLRPSRRFDGAGTAPASDPHHHAAAGMRISPRGVDASVVMCWPGLRCWSRLQIDGNLRGNSAALRTRAVVLIYRYSDGEATASGAFLKQSAASTSRCAGCWPADGPAGVGPKLRPSHTSMGVAERPRPDYTGNPQAQGVEGMVDAIDGPRWCR